MKIFNWITNKDLINDLKNDLHKLEKEKFEYVEKYLQSEQNAQKINEKFLEEKRLRESFGEQIRELKNNLHHLENENNNYFIVLDENDKLKRENKDLIEQADCDGSKSAKLLVDYNKICSEKIKLESENKKLYNLYCKAKEDNKRIRKGMRK